MGIKLKNCCFCLPLRPGLFVWGYFALVINYISILNMLFAVQDILNEFKTIDPMSFTEVTLALGMTFVHLIFYIVFVAGLHKNSRGLLEVFCGYNVIIMIFLVLATFLYVPVRAHSLYQLIGKRVAVFIVVALSFMAVTMLCQYYLIIAVRSFISKLEDDKDCSSPVSNTEDPGCIMHMYREKDFCDC